MIFAVSSPHDAAHSFAPHGPVEVFSHTTTALRRPRIVWLGSCTGYVPRFAIDYSRWQISPTVVRQRAGPQGAVGRAETVLAQLTPSRSKFAKRRGRRLPVPQVPGSIRVLLPESHEGEPLVLSRHLRRTSSQIRGTPVRCRANPLCFTINGLHRQCPADKQQYSQTGNCRSQQRLPARRHSLPRLQPPSKPCHRPLLAPNELKRRSGLEPAETKRVRL